MLAFSNDYYGMIFRATQSVELFCAYVLIHGNQYFYYGFRDAITLIMCGGVIAILIGAIAYPLYYIWGSGKTEIVSILSLLGAVVIIVGLSIIVNITLGDTAVSDMLYYISLIVILFISLLVFEGSCIISCALFKHKEY